MTTDITELAQREKFEAWLSEKPFHARYMHWSNTLNAYDYTGIQLAWEAYQAGGAELVEVLEKAQQRIIQLKSRTVTVKLASRRLPSDYVDGEFGNDDLAAIHNACRLECKVSIEKYLSAYGIVVKWEGE